MEGEDGMAAGHAGTGKAHDVPDSFPHGGLVTVDGAAGAGRFFFSEGAPVEPLQGVR